MAEFLNSLRGNPYNPYKDRTWAVKTGYWLEHADQFADLACKAVTDPDEAVRRHAAGFFEDIPLAVPQFNHLVAACIPSLMKAVHDPNGSIFFKALHALTLIETTPVGLHDVYVQALHYKSTRPTHTILDYQGLPLDELTKRANEDQDEELRIQATSLAAAGLIMEAQPGNEQLVMDAILANHALLNSLIATNHPSENLFAFAGRFINDPDPEVQTIAILAMVHNSTDKARLTGILRLLLEKENVPESVRLEAKTQIANAETQPPGK